MSASFEVLTAMDRLLERLLLSDLPDVRASLRQQVRKTGIPDRIIDAIVAVPRHAFVPASLSLIAYAPSGNWLPSGAVLPGPATTARMLTALNPQSTERVLEIGTGCGYLTVLLGLLTREVVTVDSIDRTDGVLEAVELTNVRRGEIDGAFDAVLATTPQPVFSPTLLGGARRAVVVIGPPLGTQRLLLAQAGESGAVPELLDLGPILLPTWTYGGSPYLTPLGWVPTPLEGA
jgi:protein-L-isoaspartate(D-aspartate) O-methyltransferase